MASQTYKEREYIPWFNNPEYIKEAREEKEKADEFDRRFRRRLELAGEKTPAALAKKVRDTAIQKFGRGAVYGDVSKEDIVRNLRKPNIESPTTPDQLARYDQELKEKEEREKKILSDAKKAWGEEKKKTRERLAGAGFQDPDAQGGTPLPISSVGRSALNPQGDDREGLDDRMNKIGASRQKSFDKMIGQVSKAFDRERLAGADFQDPDAQGGAPLPISSVGRGELPRQESDEGYSSKPSPLDAYNRSMEGGRGPDQILPEAGTIAEMEMGRSTPAYRSIEEQTIEADPPEVKEMKELQVDAQKKKPGAVQARKEMFAGLPREAKAMAKEELGNYYVDPNSGLAINLTELDASANRRANMMMLQHVPKHQRATMMANWGYIDKEDVENLPEDPTIQKAKIDAANNIAVQKMKEEGSSARTGMQTSTGLAIANLHDSTARTLGVRKLDLQEARDKVADRIASGELTIKQAAQELAKTLGVRQEDRLQEMMEQELAFKYEEMEGMDAFRTAQLSQQNIQWTAGFMQKGKNEQKAWLMKQHQQGMSDIKWAMENHQFDAAVIFAAENGINFLPNADAKMRKDASKLAKKGATSGTVAALAFKYGKVPGGSDAKGVQSYLNKYHQSRVDIVKQLSDAGANVDGLTPRQVAFEEYQIQPFETAPEQFTVGRANVKKSNYASPGHYRLAMTQLIIEDRMFNAHGQFHLDYLDNEMLEKRGGGNTGGTTTPTTGGNTTTKKTKPGVTETTISAKTKIPKIADVEKNILASPRFQGIGKEKALKETLQKGKTDFTNLLDYENKKGTKRFKNKTEALDYFERFPDELEGMADDDFFKFMPGAMSEHALYYILQELKKRG